MAAHARPGLAHGPGGEIGAVSPAVVDVLGSFRRLQQTDKLVFLAHLGLSATVQAWSDVADMEASGEHLPRQALPVTLRWRSGDTPPWSVGGCPWCRRPVSLFAGQVPPAPTLPALEPSATGTCLPVLPGECAFVTLLYGPQCDRYFFGALVLGWGLRRHGGSAGVRRVLMHTPDVPPEYLAALAGVGWTCLPVEYISDVSRNLFHNWYTSRFVDVFTKLRVMGLVDFKRVLLLDLDLLVRAPAAGVEPLGTLFSLRPPAAMKRGSPVPGHGDFVPYRALWGHPARRATDSVPLHQQGSGINAGVMLLKPDEALLQQILREVQDWRHPEHYATYMPEQEYLGRLMGTVDRWTHVDCRYNYEVDKNERIPHDFTEAHEALRAADHPGVVVLHFSGSRVKPWDLLYADAWDAGSLVPAGAAGLGPLLECLQGEGPGARLEGYNDDERLWGAMLEWLGQLAEAAAELALQGCDVVAVVRRVADARRAAAKE